MIVRPVAAPDAGAIANLYNHYVATTTISFEEEPVAAGAMALRIDEAVATGLPWLVAESATAIVGYAYATKWKARSAYRHSVETSVYVAAGSVAAGIGSQLYATLLPALSAAGFHLAIGGIALPNAASVRLHEKFGFAPVAHFREVGWKFGRWIDVGYWQRHL